MREARLRYCVMLFTAVVLLLGCSEGAREGGSVADGAFEHSSGLVIEILSPGSGPPITGGQTAVVHYTGWLAEPGWQKGEKFDSSHDRNAPFPVERIGRGKVIKGWNLGIPGFEGVPGMKVGERRQLNIPPKLAYGRRGYGELIPPGASLIFEVELIEIR